MAWTLISERDSGIAVLGAANANIDNDQVVDHALPAGFGDVFVLGLYLEVGPLATAVANPELLGAAVLLVSGGAATAAEIVGDKRWTRFATAYLGLTLEPFQPVYMRESESTRFFFAEVDTDAAPTADIIARMRVKRIRNQGPQTTYFGPVRFTS